MRALVAVKRVVDYAVKAMVTAGLVGSQSQPCQATRRHLRDYLSEVADSPNAL